MPVLVGRKYKEVALPSRIPLVEVAEPLAQTSSSQRGTSVGQEGWRFIENQTILTNTAKIVAVLSMAVVPYLGMRLWVFVHTPHASKER
jgi:hypothetical protein